MLRRPSTGSFGSFANRSGVNMGILNFLLTFVILGIRIRLITVFPVPDCGLNLPDVA